MGEIKVSVIVPVYNVEEYLRECLDSVLGQTLQEIEVICVDDGSTDSSSDILKEYAEKDNRVKIKCQDNLGSGAARNNAMSEAAGKYIAFMDSDDLYPEQDTLEKLVEAAETQGCKLVGGYRQLLKDGEITEEEYEKTYKLIKENPQGCLTEYSQIQTDFNFQCYIYEREMLEKENIVFPDYRRFQYPSFFVKAMRAANTVYLIPGTTYLYRMGNSSAEWTPEEINDLIRGHIDVLNMAEENDLQNLYQSTVKRLNNRYKKPVILKNISLDNIEAYLLLVSFCSVEAPAKSEDDTEDKTSALLTQLLIDTEKELAILLSKEYEEDSEAFFDFISDTQSEFLKQYSDKKKDIDFSLLRVMAHMCTQGNSDAVKRIVNDFLQSQKYNELGLQAYSYDEYPLSTKEAIDILKNTEAALRILDLILCNSQEDEHLKAFSENAEEDEFMSVAEIVISACIYHLNTADSESESERRSIYKGLLNPYIEKIGLLNRPLDLYQSKDDVMRLQRAKYIVKRHNKMYMKADKDFGLSADAQTETNKPVVSVIIPVYNAAPYLEECLDSIVNQTLREIEIICVDDGSTDETPDILAQYEKHDSRIRVLHQENQYAGVARNNGLKIAKGEYVIFLDSDDFFDLQLLEKTYTKAKEKSADIILCNAKRYDDKKHDFQKALNYFRKQFIGYKEVFSGKDNPDKFLRITSPCTWTKLFRRDFVIENKLSFQSLQNSNDVYFVLMALCLAEKVSYVDEELAYYRTHADSNLQNEKNNHYLDCFTAYEAVYEELNKRGIYEDVERSFVDTAIFGIIDNLNSAKNDLIKREIHLYMTTPEFKKMHLLDYPDEYYESPACASRLRGSEKILKWQEKHKKEDKEFKILVDRRSKADSTPFVSVIIPVYNVYDYLEECLDSIANQSLSQIEIICIDDGSSDASLDILMKYAKKDSRVVVCTQKNSGQSAARNKGIQNALGKYLYFMDSDDILDLTALELLYEKMEEDRLDILYFDGTSFAESLVSEDMFESYKTYYIRSKTYDDIYTGKRLMIEMHPNDDYRVSPCMQMTNKEFFYNNDLWFCDGVLYEDNLYTFKSMMCAERTSHISNQLYRRRVRNNSTMTKKMHFANTYGYFRCYLGMYDIYKEEIFETEEDEVIVLRIVNANLSNSRRIYNQITIEEKQTYYALPAGERQRFKALIIDTDFDKIKSLEYRLQRANAEKTEINNKLKTAYEEKAEISIELKSVRDTKSDVVKKLKKANAKKSELSQKLEKANAKKTEEIKKLKKANARKKELNQKLEQANDEIDKLKAELEAVKNSKSYKIGNGIMWLPRKIKRGDR